MNPVLVYLLALCADYFLARSITMLEGPFGLFAAARERFDPEQTTWLGRGLNCPICVGFWVSFALAVLLLAYLPAALFPLNWLGLAGANMVLHLVVERWLS